MEDFDALLKGMHDRGIKLVMDLVVNQAVISTIGLSKAAVQEIILIVITTIGGLLKKASHNIAGVSLTSIVMHGLLILLQIVITYTISPSSSPI